VRVAHIPKNHLMLIAGLVWCAAGAMVCLIGLPLEFGLAPSHLILFPLAVVIFLVFYFLVFSRLVRKHTDRIRARTEDRLPAWNFFNASSWAVMAVMMGGGMALRFSHLMPDWMIAFFYSGLGVALFLCGVRFLGVFARRDVLAVAPDHRKATFDLDHAHRRVLPDHLTGLRKPY
jgi:small-conductance mechanosensitive channel